MIPDPKGEWKKSSFSSGQNGDCVELRVDGEMAAVRDSKNPGMALEFSWETITSFVSRVSGWQ